MARPAPLAVIQRSTPRAAQRAPPPTPGARTGHSACGTPRARNKAPPAPSRQGDRRSPKPFGRITQDTRVILARFFDPICGDDHPCISRSARRQRRGCAICSSQSVTEDAQLHRMFRRSLPSGRRRRHDGAAHRGHGVQFFCSAMTDGCSGPLRPPGLVRQQRWSDRRSTVVLNVARRHRASQAGPGRQGRGSRRAWPGGAMYRTRSEVCWREQESCRGSVQTVNLRNCRW
jgi:hypothetical protein